jgi:hypothetical protein
MTNSLDIFERWFWISLALFLLYAGLFVFKIRRRDLWIRHTASQSGVPSRAGWPRRIAQSIRRFGESRLLTWCLGILALLFGVLVALNAGAYLHYRKASVLAPESRGRRAVSSLSEQIRPPSGRDQPREGCRAIPAPPWPG